MDALPHIGFVLRSYRPCDAAACRRLFVEGLIGGRIADGDAGADVEQIEQHYLARPGNHFWVAELAGPTHGDGPTGDGTGNYSRSGTGVTGEVVGMVGVRHHSDGTGEIRRLRVDERFRRRGIGSALMEQALRFCQQQGYLRIILDTFMEREPAVRLFEKFRFRHGRTRGLGEKDLLYFYLDLYGKTGGTDAGH